MQLSNNLKLDRSQFKVKQLNKEYIKINYMIIINMKIKFLTFIKI